MKQFLAEFPDLVSQLHPSLNQHEVAWKVSLGSGRKLWWQCPNGHAFERTITNQIKGGACPVCSNKEFLKGFNDISTLYPELATAFDPAKNNGLSAVESIAQVNKTYFWLCAHGHSFERRLGYMLESSKCPFCTGRTIDEDNKSHSFGALHPGLLVYWDYFANNGLDPETLHPGTNLNVSWKCELGHPWTAPPSRLIRGSRCPFCANVNVLEGFNDLATLYPEVASQWDPEANSSSRFSTTTIGAGSHEYITWRCSKDHVWKAQVRSRTYQKTGCPKCRNSGKVPRGNLNNAPQEVQILWDEEANGLSLAGVPIGAETKYRWKCSFGHSWLAAPWSVYQRPWCKACAGASKLDTRFSLEVMETWDPEKNLFELEDFSPSSNKTASWICNLGHTWDLSIHQRVRAKGCPICRRKELLEGFNDFATTHPELAKQWSRLNLPLTPSKVFSGSSKKFWWECSFGHTWKTSVSERAGRNSQCPSCSGDRLEVGFNDLMTSYPDVAEEWHPSRNGSLTPGGILAHTSTKVWWQCSEDSSHEWEASPLSRTTRSSGCPACVGKKLILGVNDFQTKYPDLAKEWDYQRNAPLKPNEIVRGALQTFWWICEDGHSYLKTVGNLITAQAYGRIGCPSCATYGFLKSEAAKLYFISHSRLGALKVGIANSNSNRLEKFSKLGWTSLGVWEHEVGTVAQATETTVLRWIRADLKLPPYLGEPEMEKMGGWTETFSAEAVSTTLVTAKIEEVWSIYANGGFFK